MGAHRFAFVLALFLSGCETATPAPAPPKATLRETVFDAGVVEQGTEITHAFRLYNEGDQDLYVREVRSSCGCMVASPPPSTVAPGDGADIEITFNTTAYFGPVRRTASILTNDPEQPVRTVQIRANIEYEAAVEPPELYAGIVTRGQSVTAFPRVLLGDGIEITGLETKSKVVAVAWRDDPPSGSTPRFTLSIRADAPTGEFRETVVVRTSSERRPAIAVPVVGTVSEETDELLSNRG